MKYGLDIHLDVTVEELYELQGSLTKKLKNEMLGRKITEKRMEELVGQGSIQLDNILLCELNAAEMRIQVLTELLLQIKSAFAAAQAQETRTFRRTRARTELDAERSPERDAEPAAERSRE